MFYKQCMMTRVSETSHDTHIAWIPEQFAHEGKVVDVLDNYGEWSKNWTVDVVYQNRVSEEYIREHQDDYKNQRKASDI